jgi:hypothetical protein
MNRRSIFTLSAITVLGVGLLPSSIVAQQGSLKQQLIGTWTPVSMTTAVIVANVGTNPKGILVFDANGLYVQMLEKTDRPKSASRSDGMVANFGTWSVNEADKTITTHADGALGANFEGTDLKASVSLTGDELKLTTTNPATGARGDTVYRRAR